MSPKTKFNEAVTELIERTKAGDPELLDRGKRIKQIDALIENYVRITDGKIPEPYELERLGSLILREELTDSDLHKRNEDEPFQSVHQLERRRRHETSFKLAEEVGVDRVSYRKPTRENKRKF